MHSLLNLLLGLGFSATTRDWIILAADLLALASVPSVLLRRRGRPLAAIGWLLAVLAVPIFGVCAWWFLGRTHLYRLRRRRRKSLSALAERAAAWRATLEADGCAGLAKVIPFATSSKPWEEGVFQPTQGNTVTLLVDGEKAYPAMAAAISNARRDVRVLTYIWETDDAGTRFRDLLVTKAKQGIAVRILVDAVGSPKIRGEFIAPLLEAGAQVVTFLPVRFRPWSPTFNFRNHRKLLVIDGEVAFTGGMNIGDVYERVWRDLAVEIRGPAVPQLDAVFQEDWFFATKEDLSKKSRGGQAKEPRAPAPIVESLEGKSACAVLASGPDLAENRIHDAFLLAISQARRRVLVTTPYFVPSTGLLATLRSVAQRGVEVKILVPQRNDVWLVGLASRSYYPSLLSQGVKIFEYGGEMLHTKALIIDDWLSVIGSANVDSRSFRLNFELACLISSSELNAELTQVFEASLKQSAEVTLAAMEKRGLGAALAESFAHLLSPLL